MHNLPESLCTDGHFSVTGIDRYGALCSVGTASESVRHSECRNAVNGLTGRGSASEKYEWGMSGSCQSNIFVNDSFALMSHDEISTQL